jgi:hypothetical protein
MVFHITGRQVVSMLTFKFSKQVLRHFTERIHQNIQTPTVRHADNNFFNTALTGTLNRLIHRSNKTFATLERKRF